MGFKMGILILDDDQDALDAITETLALSDIENVKTFKDSESFLKQISDGELCMAVLDHRLPKIDGLEVLKMIKAKNRWSFVISYTGINDPELLRNYINADVDKAIDKNKPFSLNQLIEFVRTGIPIVQERKLIVDKLLVTIERYE